jgi:hypothetical protein
MFRWSAAEEREVTATTEERERENAGVRFMFPHSVAESVMIFGFTLYKRRRTTASSFFMLFFFLDKVYILFLAQGVYSF